MLAVWSVSQLTAVSRIWPAVLTSSMPSWRRTRRRGATRTQASHTSRAEIVALGLRQRGRVPSLHASQTAQRRTHVWEMMSAAVLQLMTVLRARPAVQCKNQLDLLTSGDPGYCPENGRAQWVRVYFRSAGAYPAGGRRSRSGRQMLQHGRFRDGNAQLAPTSSASEAAELLQQNTSSLHGQYAPRQTGRDSALLQPLADARTHLHSHASAS